MPCSETSILCARYWEHQIRDETDLAHHVDYIHCNAVKHGLVTRPVDRSHSMLHAYIDRKMISKEWGVGMTNETNGYGTR